MYAIVRHAETIPAMKKVASSAMVVSKREDRPQAQAEADRLQREFPEFSFTVTRIGYNRGKARNHICSKVAGDGRPATN